MAAADDFPDRTFHAGSLAACGLRVLAGLPDAPRGAERYGLRALGCQFRTVKLHRHRSTRLEHRMPGELQCETVHLRGVDLDPVFVRKLRIDGREFPSSQSVDPYPVRRTVLVKPGSESHAVREAIPPELCEPVEDCTVFISVVPGIVLDARILDVFSLHAEAEQQLVPGPRDVYGNRGVDVAVKQLHWQMKRVPSQFLSALCDRRANQSDRRPDIRSRESEPKRAAAAH